MERSEAIRIIGKEKEKENKEYNENNENNEYNLQENEFNPYKCSPPNDFLVKLKTRYNTYYLHSIRCKTK
jgi:hypothetical protein